MSENEYPISKERLCELARQLHASWVAQEGLEVTKTDFEPSQRIYAVYALAAHVHSLSPSVVNLFREGVAFTAIPLVRVMYECALTSQWIQLRSDAANAFLNRDIKRRQALERTLPRASSRVFQESSVAGVDVDELETAATGPAGNFERLCDELTPGGTDAYIYYRIMSWYSHPSVALVDRYLIPGEDEELPAVSEEPVTSESDLTFLYLAVCSMVWSGNAVDAFDTQRTRKVQLQAVADELGIQAELGISAD